MDFSSIKHSVKTVLDDLQEVAKLEEGQLLVVGTSTSEVIGKHIGSAGTVDAAAEIWTALHDFAEKTGVDLAFQCCEHLNRALVIQGNVADKYGYERVSAIPIPSAGGSMAAFAFENMTSPVLVEEIKADAGIDIGDTLIGMHLKRVAVPVRSKIKTIGEAHMTMATTRPKLIGGERAIYHTGKNNQSCH
ncbi:TIGR01440 family protein [Evansella cellulosilytica]|uniref:UPF0340 protein Bcell_4084 n=1 Tax=Evansella cellulosilytica (strain ATCC 21833 / DSM 2522 / FERM P-1141 / JCM 9156 / N-4) TaxID=649639 RepID=E6TXB9_EVAC2|nr:TIGR01440 family protein [Evansella cellulosilytica]ADU32314.1 Conserved hypothetical protein CHP01440 [Evansella cellulosilytica DSM 2522]